MLPEAELDEKNCPHDRGQIVAYGWRGHRWLEVCKNCGRPAYVTHYNEIVPLYAPQSTGDGDSNG